MDTLDLSLAVEAKRALIARVAASELFQKAPRLREFLLYAGKCTLENRLSEVREQVIAERVFCRNPDFQGTQDSIVRAEARNLRRRLETYFATEGSGETVIISMPKGGYALAFEPRPPAIGLQIYSPPIPAVSTAVPAPVSELEGDPPKRPVRWGRPAWFLCTVGFLLAMTAIAFALGRHEGETQLKQRLGITPPMLPFSALFSQNRESLIITSDTGFLQIAMLAHRALTLNDYIARSYPDVLDLKPPDQIRNWNLYEFTDGREMSVAGLMMRSYPQFAGRVALRSGHEVTLDELKTHTAVLIGSPISNPWAQLFEDRLNFRCQLDPSGSILFRNSGARSDASARIAFLPGSADTPAALLIAGTTAQSTEAAGELITNRARFARTLHAIGIKPTERPRFFEILLRSNVFVGGSTVPEIVAWRLTPAPEKE